MKTAGKKFNRKSPSNIVRETREGHERKQEQKRETFDWILIEIWKHSVDSMIFNNVWE